MQKFKIRASKTSDIMGRMGLTEIQESTIVELQNKPKLTDKQRENLDSLLLKKENANSFLSLPDTCTSYLKQWYTGEQKELFTKEIQKGLLCEHIGIQELENFLDIGFMKKNEQFFEDEFCTGTPDIITPHKGLIFDIKLPWNRETFNKSALSENSPNYEWQMITYMKLVKGINNAYVTHILIDTPEEVNYGNEVIYSEPIDERINFALVEKNIQKENEIEERVKLCRLWLEDYHKKIVDMRLKNKSIKEFLAVCK